MQLPLEESKKAPDPPMDIDQMLEMIEEDRVSTKSVHGSNENKDFSKYKDMRLSRLFESLQYGVHSSDEKHMNKSDTCKNHTVQNSEIFALKREIERKARKPIAMNVMVVGKKAVGKTSFIRMLLNYVLAPHLAQRRRRAEGRGEVEGRDRRGPGLHEQQTGEQPEHPDEHHRHARLLRGEPQGVVRAGQRRGRQQSSSR